MSEQESLHSKVKNSLTRSLGGELDTHVDLFEMDLQTGDRLLLSTDGLLRYTTRREIAAMLSTGTPREVAERMVSYALEQGGADNITVLPIEVGPRLEEGTLAAVGSMATPEPAEWELMATEAISPPMTAVAPKKRRKAWRKQQYYILYGLFGGITLTSLVMLGFFIFSTPKLDFAWLTNRVGTSTEGVPVTSTIEPALAAVDVPLITETATPAVTATETPTLLPTSTFMPTFTSTPILVTCVYQVQSGENLITILEGFGQVYNYCDEKYFYYLSCEELPDQANKVACTDQKRIRFEDDDVNCEQPDLQVNTWVEIKNVILEACVNGDEDGGGGGKILSEQTQ